MATATKSKFSTVLEGKFSWNGGPEQPVKIKVAHAPEVAGADSRPPSAGIGRVAPIEVPPPPDYSTSRAVTQRCLERGTRNPFHLEIMRLAEHDGTHAAFRKAVERAGGTLRFMKNIRDKHKPRVMVADNPDWLAWYDANNIVRRYGQSNAAREKWRGQPEPPRRILVPIPKPSRGKAHA